MFFPYGLQKVTHSNISSNRLVNNMFFPYGLQKVTHSNISSTSICRRVMNHMSFQKPLHRRLVNHTSLKKASKRVLVNHMSFQEPLVCILASPAMFSQTLLLFNPLLCIHFFAVAKSLVNNMFFPYGLQKVTHSNISSNRHLQASDETHVFAKAFTQAIGEPYFPEKGFKKGIVEPYVLPRTLGLHLCQPCHLFSDIASVQSLTLHPSLCSGKVSMI